MSTEQEKTIKELFDLPVIQQDPQQQAEFAVEIRRVYFAPVSQRVSGGCPTAKDYLFTVLHRMDGILKCESLDSALHEELRREIEKALSWESEISNSDMNPGGIIRR